VNAEQALYGAFEVKRFSRRLSIWPLIFRGQALFKTTFDLAIDHLVGLAAFNGQPWGLSLTAVSTATLSGRSGRKPSIDDQRGACLRARIIAPQPCIR
jgi:hypothetical protein